MSLVLAIEPDRVQADILREVHATLGVQLQVVSSKDEAIMAIEREVPDLILVNALLSPREEVDLVAHLRSLDNLAHLQLLTIPRLARAKTEAAAAKKSSLFGFGKKRAAAPLPDGCDPAAFAEEVTLYLSRAEEVKARPKPRVAPAPKAPPVVAPLEDQTPLYQPPAAAASHEEAERAPVYEAPRAFRQYEPPLAQETPRTEPAPSFDVFETALGTEPAAEPMANVDQLFDRLGFGPDSSMAAPPIEAPTAEEPPLVADPEILIDLDTFPDVQREPEITRSEPVSVDFDLPTQPVEPPIAASEPPAAEREHALPDLAKVRAEAEAALAAELQRVHSEAAQQRERDLAQWQAEAEALREATIGQARADAEASAREALAEELARTRAESEQVRHDEIARLQAEADQRLEEVTRQARQVAESEAARAFAEELTRVRADAESSAARTLEREIARVRAESDGRLQAELERVRRDAEQARLAEQAAAHAEAERIREAAARDAREIAETAAARTLEAEVQRVRAEAEAVRVAAEARLAEQSKAQADASQAIAEAERVREAAAREAREIAEATAARKLEAELQRVRAESEARLAAHNEAQLHAEKRREAAAREAHAAAEAATTRKLEVEIQRVRAEADTRLGSELAQLRADAERRRAIELDEMRRQVEELRATAAEQARTAAAEAVAAEVARAAAMRGAVPPPRPVPLVKVAAAKAAPPPAPAADHAAAPSGSQTPSSSYYDLWRAEGSPGSEPAQQPSWVRSVPSRFREKRWMLPAAAAGLLVICGGVGMSVDTAAWAATARKAIASALPARASDKPEAPPPVAPPSGDLLVETTPKGAQVSVDGTVRGKTPLTITALSPGLHKVVLESSDGVVIRRDVTIRAGERAVTSELMVSGWLTVSSNVPVEVHAGGRRVGASGGEQIVLSPGRHKLTFLNKRYNIRETRTVDVRAGSIGSHVLKLPAGSLTVDGPAGAEVLIGGDRVGEAPLRGASVPLGTHELVVRHPSFGEKRETVDVRHAMPVKVSVGATDASQAPDRSFDGLKVLSESAANPGVRKPRQP